MIFGIIYNASSAVPGPSALKGGHSGASERQADGTSLGKRNAIGAAETGDDQEDEGQDEYEHMSPRKRLRMLAASLPIKERQRIKAAGKPSERAGISGPNTSSWAGAGADLLEKRRKEEEKKSKEAERKRLREVHTEIGSIDWTRETLLAEAAKQEVRPKLPVGSYLTSWPAHSLQHVCTVVTRLVLIAFTVLCTSHTRTYPPFPPLQLRCKPSCDPVRFHCALSGRLCRNQSP